MKSRKLIDELRDRLRLERRQTSSECAVVLTMISGSSFLALPGLSGQMANAVLDVVRLLP